MKRSGLVAKLIAGLVSTGLYLPVVAGIITPMLWLLPAWYLAWHVIGYIFPFSEYWGGLWLPLPTEEILVFIAIAIVEIVLLVCGVVLLIGALVVLTRGRMNGRLVAAAPYSWVRHPQHLGIILFLLPLALFQIWYPPGVWWIGIRPGDILSWSLVAFLLIVAADLEEINLAAQFGSSFSEYCSMTPFIFPVRVPWPGFLQTGRFARGRVERYLIWFAIYWILISGLLFLFTFLDLQWTR